MHVALLLDTMCSFRPGARSYKHHQATQHARLAAVAKQYLWHHTCNQTTGEHLATVLCVSGLRVSVRCNTVDLKTGLSASKVSWME